MDKYEEIWGILSELNEDELIALHNDFVEFYGDDSDHIYYMNEFDDMARDYCPSELLEKTEDDFELWRDYFCIDDWDREFHSFDDIFDKIDCGEIADFMIANCDDGGIAEIAEILENDDEDDEEIA